MSPFYSHLLLEPGALSFQPRGMLHGPARMGCSDVQASVSMGMGFSPWGQQLQPKWRPPCPQSFSSRTLVVIVLQGSQEQELNFSDDSKHKMTAKVAQARKVSFLKNSPTKAKPNQTNKKDYANTSEKMKN